MNGLGISPISRAASSSTTDKFVDKKPGRANSRTVKNILRLFDGLRRFAELFDDEHLDALKLDKVVKRLNPRRFYGVLRDTEIAKALHRHESNQSKNPEPVTGEELAMRLDPLYIDLQLVQNNNMTFDAFLTKHARDLHYLADVVLPALDNAKKMLAQMTDLAKGPKGFVEKIRRALEGRPIQQAKSQDQVAGKVKETLAKLPSETKSEPWWKKAS